jgi:hypothetical protein
MHGSGGGGEVRYDNVAMSEAACALRSSTASLDSAGDSVPPGGDYGAAAPLVAAIVGAVSDAGASIGAEASVLADTVDLVGSSMQLTDAQQAVDVLRTGQLP